MIVVGGEALVDLVDDHGLLRPVPGGGPFNTAIALGRLGIPVAFLGTLSHDDYGSLLAGLLLEAGVDMSLVRSVRCSDAARRRPSAGRRENTYTFYLTGTSLTDLPPEAVPALPERRVWRFTWGRSGWRSTLPPPRTKHCSIARRGAGRSSSTRTSGRRSSATRPRIELDSNGSQGGPTSSS